MRADLDLLCISVYCTADDLLPARPGNGRRKLTDAEIVTLCVAQVLMGIPSDRRFLRAARRQLGHLFPLLPTQDALHKRRRRLSDTIEWLIGVFTAQSPGSSDDLVLLDSTPVECGRSLETTRRSDLADVCGYGYCKSHSRWFWVFCFMKSGRSVIFGLLIKRSDRWLARLLSLLKTSSGSSFRSSRER